MDGENSAFGAANHRHHRYMVFGKKQRYIEVFQCSGEDMSVVLTGGAGGQPGKPGVQPGGQPGGGLVSPGMLPVVPGYVEPTLALTSPQPGMLPLGVPQLLPQLPQLPHLLPGAPRPDQLWQLGGLGGLPQVAPQLLMFPPRLGVGLPGQHRYLLPSPAQPGGNKRTHEQAFLPPTPGALHPTLPPKRPPVMYNTGGGAGGGGPGTPPATPALLPTPGVFPVQGTPSTVAAFPAV